MHTAITYSPSSKSDSNCDSNENSERIVHPQGMKHKIPHRFCEVMCMRNSKCCICLDSMYLGRSIVKCQECLLECHLKCASSLPKTCGLPSGFMQHFKTAVRSSLSVDKVEEIPNISEGWIKVPKINKHDWDRRYMRFEDSVLYIFETAEEKDPDEALLEIDFLSDKASITVSSSVSVTELPYAANSDLPFVLKVESFPHTACLPKRILYIMTSNFNEKQMWVSVLEKAAEISLSEVDSSHKWFSMSFDAA
ncbi:citron Rho-interacting kinase-like [Parasteatoda tepidariorum]|uniref:citron Rho-interacting kinase-like n=1 Tax=Parasteatoda tepidariorum TaxID=114398 RepID=UPI001C721E64|nr:citron Rho-interacting kinase-like [Parasteatoda tepidariorum]